MWSYQAGSNWRRRTATLGLLLAAAVAWTGCARPVTDMPVRIGTGGIPTAFKRAERYPQRDFMHHWVRRAYYQASDPFTFPPKTDQGVTIEQWGKPDWVRKPFRSIQSELVEEWIYLNEATIFQFIGPQKVYEGPLTDYEQKLLERGFPDHAVQSHTETGSNFDMFVYYKIFWPEQEVFHFANGQLVQIQEGS